MKKLIFCILYIFCSNLFAEQLTKNTLIFDDGNVTLEFACIHLFDPVTLPKYTWKDVTHYETNNKDVAERFINRAQDTIIILEEKKVNALYVALSGDCFLGYCTIDENGKPSFSDLCSYKPFLWTMDINGLKEDLTLMLTQPCILGGDEIFLKYGAFYNGFLGFKFTNLDGKINILCKEYLMNFDPKFENCPFYLSTTWDVIKDLKIKEKIQLPNVIPDQMIKDMKAAAENGHYKVQYYLGRMYLYGIGVEQSSGEAKRWFKFSADQGCLEAIYEMKKL